MAEKYGWPLEYIDGLSYADVIEKIQYEDGLAKVKGSIFR